MTGANDSDEPDLRWIETPKGRAIINAVSLTVLLAITQQFGYIAPGPPVTLENITLYAIYGAVVGLLMYVWTDFRIKRRRKKIEMAKSSGVEKQFDDNGNA